MARLVRFGLGLGWHDISRNRVPADATGRDPLWLDAALLPLVQWAACLGVRRTVHVILHSSKLCCWEARSCVVGRQAGVVGRQGGLRLDAWVAEVCRVSSSELTHTCFQRKSMRPEGKHPWVRIFGVILAPSPPSPSSKREGVFLPPSPRLNQPWVKVLASHLQHTRAHVQVVDGGASAAAAGSIQHLSRVILLRHRCSGPRPRRWLHRIIHTSRVVGLLRS